MLNPDQLELLKVKTVEVLCGEWTLKLRTPSMAQQQAFGKALAQIDVKPFLAAAQEVVGSIGGNGFLDALVKNGAELYQTGVSLLSSAAGDHLAALVGIALDTSVNFEILKTGSSGLVDADKDLDDRQRYRGSERFRLLLAEQTTLPQALYIAEEIVRMGDYKRLMGKLIAGLRLGSGSAKTSTPDEQPETDSSAAEGGLQA